VSSTRHYAGITNRALASYSATTRLLALSLASRGTKWEGWYPLKQWFKSQAASLRNRSSWEEQHSQILGVVDRELSY
jgi:hypothetical protein